MRKPEQLIKISYETAMYTRKVFDSAIQASLLYGCESWLTNN